jgi:hypothetical protein
LAPKEDKDIVETPSPGTPITQSASSSTLEDRIAQLEAIVLQWSHLISGAQRPDLSTGALKREPDLGGSDPAALSQQLQKQAIEAKQAKDNKDAEKLREA